MSDRRKRLHTLLTDRAAQGLDERQRVELELMLGGEAIDSSYEEAAAAIELALLPHDEALPATLSSAVFEQAAGYFGFTDARHHEQTRGGEPRARRPRSGPHGRAYLDPETELGEIEEDAILINSIIADSVNEVIDASVLADSSASRKAATAAIDPAALSSSEMSNSFIGMSQSSASTSLAAPRDNNSARYAAYFSAAAAIVVLGLALWLFSQRERALDPSELQAKVEAADDSLEWKFVATDDPANTDASGGSVVWSSELQAGVMTLRGLGVNDPTELQYQLWIVDGNRARYPVDGGVFNIDGSGDLEILIDAKLLIGSPGAFVITVEAPGGVVVSSQERVALVAKAG